MTTTAGSAASIRIGDMHAIAPNDLAGPKPSA